MSLLRVKICWIMSITAFNVLVQSRSLHAPRVDPPAHQPEAYHPPPALRQHVERKPRVKMRGGKLELEAAHFIFMCSKHSDALRRACRAAGGHCEPLFCSESARNRVPQKSSAARRASGGACAGASERLWVWVWVHRMEAEG